MREGVGVSRSLAWSAQRFAQRALEDFFTFAQLREFVIDSGVAAEFAAKAVVAQEDPARLFDARDQPPLSADQLAIIDPHSQRVRPGPTVWSCELAALLELQTLSASEAIGAAAQLCRVDSGAAQRVLAARNRAAHIGDVDREAVDGHARDFLRVIETLWLATHRPTTELWCDLTPIADARHLRLARGPKAEVEVRVALARRRWSVDLFAAHRRGQLRLDADDLVRCPVCGNGAACGEHSASSAGNLPVVDENQLVQVLDCLHCGLTIVGAREIRWARRMELNRGGPPGLAAYPAAGSS